MREHFVDVSDPQANVPRPAHVVGPSRRDLLPPRRVMKDEQFQKQILRPAKRNLEKANTHIYGFRLRQKPADRANPRFLKCGKVCSRLHRRVSDKSSSPLRDRSQRHEGSRASPTKTYMSRNKRVRTTPRLQTACLAKPRTRRRSSKLGCLDPAINS